MQVTNAPSFKLDKRLDLEGPKFPRHQVIRSRAPLIIKAYKTGLSYRMIAEIFDVSTYTVGSILKDNGVRIRKRGRPS